MSTTSRTESKHRSAQREGARAGRHLAAAVFATLALAAAGCGERTRVAALPPGATVVALGDSLTYGTGATPDTRYPAFLAEATRWNVVNAGIPGDTAEQGCARLPPLVAENQPALVLVFLGGNDILRQRGARLLREGLAACVHAAAAAGVPLVLLAVPTFGVTGFTDAAIVEDFAKEAKVPWLSPGLGKLLRDDAMRSDAIHLNAAGYRALATNVADELRRLGYVGR